MSSDDGITERTSSADAGWPFTGDDAPVVVFFGAGASRAEPLELPTSAEFFQNAVRADGEFISPSLAAMSDRERSVLQLMIHGGRAQTSRCPRRTTESGFARRASRRTCPASILDRQSFTLECG